MKVAYEYKGFLVEVIAGIGEGEIGKLDLGERVDNYYSMGCCDPIEVVGKRPRYEVREIPDPPQWLVGGLAVMGVDNPVREAVLIYMGRSDAPQAADLRELIFKHSRFCVSLQEFYAERGFLSVRQIRAMWRAR